MNNQRNVSMPRNSDGTVNWVVVFDDPDQGILAGIGKATSAAHLTGLITQIGPLLFQRKNDAEKLAKFIADMNEIVNVTDDTGFEATRDRLSNAMIAEKDRRIASAEKYIANKRSGQSIERRKDNEGINLKQMLFGTPVRLCSTLGVLLVVIGLGAGLSWMHFGPPPSDVEVKAEQKKPEEKEDAALAPTPSKELPFMKKKALYPVFLMQPITVQHSAGRQFLVPVIVAPSVKKPGLICRLGPRFAEKVLFKATQMAKGSNILKPEDLYSIAAYLRKDTNAILKGKFIQAIYLVNSTKLDNQALRVAYRGCGKHILKVRPEEYN